MLVSVTECPARLRVVPVLSVSDETLTLPLRTGKKFELASIVTASELVGREVGCVVAAE